MWARAALTALIGIVVVGSVHAHPRFTVLQTIKALGELHKSLNAKRIFVCDDSPHIYSLANPRLQLFNFNIRVKFGNGGRQDFMHPRADNANAAMRGYVWQREIEVVRKWHLKDIGSRSENDFIGWGAAIIQQSHAWLESPRLCASLRHHTIEYNRQIRTALKFGYNLLPIGYCFGYPNAFLHALNICCHGFGNSFHCAGRPSGLANGIGHIGSLVAGDFIHFPYGLPQAASLHAEHDQLKHADKNQSPREPNQPRVGRRFLLVLCGVLGGFFLSLRGWDCFDNQRKSFGSALIGIGWLVAAGGFVLWWLSSFPWSWSWPI